MQPHSPLSETTTKARKRKRNKKSDVKEYFEARGFNPIDLATQTKAGTRGKIELGRGKSCRQNLAQSR